MLWSHIIIIIIATIIVIVAVIIIIVIKMIAIDEVLSYLHGIGIRPHLWGCKTHSYQRPASSIHLTVLDLWHMIAPELWAIHGWLAGRS